MQEPKKRWISDYLVESELLLVPNATKLQYIHPHGLFEVHIGNAPAGHADGLLSVQIIVSAANINEAELATHSHLDTFLHLLSFITSTGYRIFSRLHLTDWSPGIWQREQFVYTKETQRDTTEALSAELLDTARMLHNWGVTPVLERSLRWFAAGVRSRIMEDQFQFFWFVIELIALSTRSTERVADRCQKCRGELYCNTCGEISTHRPFPVQSITALLEKIAIPSEVIEDLFLIRNGLMHGEAREAIINSIQEKRGDFSFDRAVDVIGKVAWTVILNAFNKPPGEHNPQFLQVSTFVDWQLTAKAHMILGVGGDVNNPKIEDVKLPKVEIITSELPEGS
jgi:hypothetical protein